MPHPTWYIAGVGALGTVLATHLVKQTIPLKLILKDEMQLATYQVSGLTLLTPNKTMSCHPKALCINQINEPIDYLICCVKAYDVTSLLLQLKAHLTSQSIIILIHNGLGVLEEIDKHLPHLRIVSAISTIGAYLEEPFKARAFLKGKFSLGCTRKELTLDEIQVISSLFEKTKLRYQWESDISPLLWEKFALNCSINILTALFSCKNKDILKHPKHLEGLTAEIAAVLSAYGVLMTKQDLLAKIHTLMEEVGDNYSSMYKDIQQKRPTELPYLNHYLVKLAKNKNIPTPCHFELLREFNTINYL
jgi:2-dehydropantoate 2-reductase